MVRLLTGEPRDCCGKWMLKRVYNLPQTESCDFAVDNNQSLQIATNGDESHDFAVDANKTYRLL